jgi:hypothetical protein
MSANRLVRQAVLVTDTNARPNQLTEYLALVNEDGTPIEGVTFEELPTGADVLLTGYVTGAWSAVAASDTVNAAIAKLANFRVGSNIVLTGYTIGAVALAAVGATDTVNQAIGKLEKRVADLEAV